MVENPIDAINTLKSFRGTGLLDEVLENRIELLTISNHKSFLDFIFKAVDKSIKDLERHREHAYHDGKRIREEAITNLILAPLRVQGINAEAEVSNSGHCDIDISFREWKWLGEAKIHSDYDHLVDGLKQLTTRYSSGEPSDSAGGMFIYIYNKKGIKVMDKFREYLEGYGVNLANCSFREVSFIGTINEHEVSGLPYVIRFSPVFLYYSPKK